jgi:hypothetical protein
MLLAIPKAQVDWSSGEKSELQRLHTVYRPPRYEIECSLTEDGDPWCVVYDCVRDEITVHIARIGSRYIVVHPDKNLSRSAAHIKNAIDLAVQ